MPPPVPRGKLQQESKTLLWHLSADGLCPQILFFKCHSSPKFIRWSEMRLPVPVSEGRTPCQKPEDNPWPESCCLCCLERVCL